MKWYKFKFSCKNENTTPDQSREIIISLTQNQFKWKLSWGQLNIREGHLAVAKEKPSEYKIQICDEVTSAHNFWSAKNHT